MIPYTDVWVKGQVREIGPRVSAPRFDALRPLLSSFKRRFSILDLGCSTGYFGFRAASEYDCVVTMIGDEDIADLCEANALPHVMFLHRHVSVSNLEMIADCEHFDVVLALNVLHHFTDWRGAVNAVRRLGDHLIVETPDPCDRGACGNDRLAPIWHEFRRGDDLGDFPSHTDAAYPRKMRHLPTMKRALRRPFIGAEPGDTIHLCVDRNVKYAHIAGKVLRPWIEGINLWTFWRMGGKWPPRPHVLDLYRNLPLPAHRHGDFYPHNMIFDGERLHVIDGQDANANFEDAAAHAEGVRRLEESL